MSAALASNTSNDGASQDPLRNGRSHLDPSQNTSGYSDVSFNSVLTDDSDRLAIAPLTASSGQTSSYPKGVSQEADRDADLKLGWKVVASSSTEQLPEGGDRPGLSHSKPVIDDPLSAHLNRNAAYKDSSADAEFNTSLGTIDERTAAGFSTFDRSTSGGSFGKRMSSKPKDRVRLDSFEFDTDLYDSSAVESYPATNDDVVEAKRVQQNLERWAAEERMKRKAARLSRGSSTLGPPAASNGLARRLSSLRSSSKGAAAGLGAGPSSEYLTGSAAASSVVTQSPVLTRNGDSSRRESTSSLSFLRNGSRPNSFSSMESGNTQDDVMGRYNGLDPAGGSRSGGRVSSLGGQRSTDTNGLQDVPESDYEGYSGKGKQPMTNPFRDPSEHSTDIYGSPTLPRRYEKPKPTAARPIVTVGRASSIQRRAIEADMGGRGKGKKRGMPSIVATDTEAEVEENSSRAGGNDTVQSNPFASEEDQQGTNKTGASTTLHHGGLDDEVAMELRRSAAREGQSDEADVDGDLGEGALGVGISQQPSRVSTSSSKFRELGISDGDDWIDSMKQGSSRYGAGASRRPGGQSRESALKRPWWTEWLCGCVRADEDEEQAGRTNPME